MVTVPKNGEPAGGDQQPGSSAAVFPHMLLNSRNTRRKTPDLNWAAPASTKVTSQSQVTAQNSAETRVSNVDKISTDSTHATTVRSGGGQKNGQQDRDHQSAVAKEHSGQRDNERGGYNTGGAYRIDGNQVSTTPGHGHSGNRFVHQQQDNSLNNSLKDERGKNLPNVTKLNARNLQNLNRGGSNSNAIEQPINNSRTSSKSKRDGGLVSLDAKSRTDSDFSRNYGSANSDTGRGYLGSGRHVEAMNGPPGRGSHGDSMNTRSNNAHNSYGKKIAANHNLQKQRPATSDHYHRVSANSYGQQERMNQQQENRGLQAENRVEYHGNNHSGSGNSGGSKYNGFTAFGNSSRPQSASGIVKAQGNAAKQRPQSASSLGRRKEPAKFVNSVICGVQPVHVTSSAVGGGGFSGRKLTVNDL